MIHMYKVNADMSIIYLNTDDFYIPKNVDPSDQVKLCIKMRGLSFI